MAPVAKGQAWGQPGRLPPDGVVVRNDAEAGAALTAARASNRPFPVLGLLGGDLCRTLGGPGAAERLSSDDAMTFQIDVGEALLDGRIHLFVAHVIAHTALWGNTFAAMNAQWRGDWILGPRAHPGDGLLDVYQATLAPLARVAARNRVGHGAHVPHPGISERRLPAAQVTLPRTMAVEIDGRAVGRARVLSVRVLPAALTVVV